jgi:cbb3-type cytochrome oxidase subunit 3
MGLGKRQVQTVGICTAGICLLLLVFLAVPHHAFSPRNSLGGTGSPALAKEAPVSSCASGSASDGKLRNGLSPHSVTLTWNASIPASRSARDVVKGYYVYRSRRSHRYAKSDRLNTDPITGTTCIDRAVELRAIYFYSVKAISQGEVESEFSDEVKAVIPRP